MAAMEMQSASWGSPNVACSQILRHEDHRLSLAIYLDDHPFHVSLLRG